MRKVTPTTRREIKKTDFPFRYFLLAVVIFIVLDQRAIQMELWQRLNIMLNLKNVDPGTKKNPVTGVRG